MATVSSATNHFPTAKEGFSTTTSGAVSSGATTVGLNSVSGFSNGETVVLVIDPSDATKKQAFTGVVDTGGSQITGVVWTEGTNQGHSAGATVVDYETATHWALYSKGLQVEHNQDGTHTSITADSVTTDTISEETSANGVTIDGLNIKDSKLTTANSVGTTAVIADGVVTPVKRAGGFAAGVFTISATGALSVTGVGFLPKMVMFFGADISTAVSASCIGVAPSSSTRFASTATSRVSGTGAATSDHDAALCLEWKTVDSGGTTTTENAADFTSMDADGFTLNVTTASTSNNFMYVAFG